MLSRLDTDQRRAFLDEAKGCWELDGAWKGRYLDDPLLQQRFQLLRAPELKQLASEAGMAIGAHTLSHPVLVEQSIEFARTEIARCRKATVTFLGKPVWAFAYPFGDTDSVGDREYRLAEAAGYDCAFVNEGGYLWERVVQILTAPHPRDGGNVHPRVRGLYLGISPFTSELLPRQFAESDAE